MSVIDVTTGGPLAVMTISRPPLNLWDGEMATSLVGALDRVDKLQPRALLIRADGRVVTGGVDVNFLAGVDRVRGEELSAELLSYTRRVAGLPFPTVFAAHALCLTWGFELALACDLFLAASSARFGLVERVVGLSPFMGGTQRLALRAGPARASELVMTGDLYDAGTLVEWGVVNRALPDAGFDEAAREFARALADGPTKAHSVTKQVVRVAVADGLEAADAVMPALTGDMFATEDAPAAIARFLAEGPGGATYSGR